MTVVVLTAVGFLTSTGRLLTVGCAVYITWVSGMTFLGSMGVTRYYDSIPGETPLRKLLVVSALVGTPAYATGQLLPLTRPFTQPYPTIPNHLTVPANVSFFVLAGVVTMAVFLYVFDWQNSDGPLYADMQSA